MPTIKDLSLAAQDQVLSAVKTTQATMVDGVKTWSDAVAKFAPAGLESPALPGLDALPTPAEAVELSFAFAGKLLETQHAFALSLIAAAAPATKPAAAKK